MPVSYCLPSSSDMQLPCVAAKDIQMILRHSQLSTTMDVYVTVFRENLARRSRSPRCRRGTTKKPGGTIEAIGTDTGRS